MWSSIASCRHSMSPGSTLMNPGTSGAKPCRTAGLPVAAIIASVRPWKLRCSEMIVHRCGANWHPRSRASLHAASFASAPLWQKNARPGNACRFSRSASSTCGSV